MKPLIENKKARMEYDALETLDAGMELFGFEVKSLRSGKGSLLGSRVVVRGGEAYLLGSTIPAFQEKNAPKDFDPERTRRLLLSRKEIAGLSTYEGQKGLTVVPIMVYNKGRRLKLVVIVGRHKKKHDKRATLRDRDDRRTIERTLKNQER